jgi:hypothetical protein
MGASAYEQTGGPYLGIQGLSRQSKFMLTFSAFAPPNGKVYDPGG